MLFSQQGGISNEMEYLLIVTNSVIGSQVTMMACQTLAVQNNSQHEPTVMADNASLQFWLRVLAFSFT